MRISDWSSDVCSSDLYRPSSPSWAASTAKPSRFSRAASVSRNGASSSTRRIRIGYSSVMMCEGNRARSMCSLWKLGSSVVVTACRRPAPRLRVVHVDADTAAVVHHLDAIDAASVGLHALGVDDPAAGAALDPAHRVGQAVVAARAALLLPPWLGLHRPGPGRVAHAFDAIAPGRSESTRLNSSHH